MDNPPSQVNINLANSQQKPIFADQVAIAIKLKSVKKSEKNYEKEGLVEIIFLDMLKQQSVGEFVISRFTTRELIAALSQSLENLEKELASKEMPKQPEIKTVGGGDYSNIR